MADTTFVAQSTVITAEWLNEVNNLVHKIFGNPTYASQVITVDGSGNLQFANNLTVDGTSTFTGAVTANGDLTLSNTSPKVIFDNTNATADNGITQLVGTTSGGLLRTRDDADSSSENIIEWARTGTTVDSVSFPNGNVGIGVTPTQKLQADGPIRISESGTARFDLQATSSAGTIFRTIGAYPQIFKTSDTERMRIDSSGNVGIGTSNPDGLLHVLSGSAGTVTPDTDADDLVIENSAEVGITFVTPGSGKSKIAFGNPGAGGEFDGGIEYWHESHATTANRRNMLFYTGKSERMRIDSAGRVLIGKTSTSLGTEGHEFFTSGEARHTKSEATPLLVNRLTNDGTLIDFYQDSNKEGDISVSGTTVSYNGAHLSRWSQWEDGPHQNRPEILRGTVLSNRDEMCVWLADEWTDADGAKHHELYDGELQVGATYIDDDGITHTIVKEDNEQLNKVVVSDAAGDKDVAGVFQGYDEDDLYAPYDFYVAQTGDFVIRIAQGTTVQRGDLLISAGDGTAKPQTDDIVRSSTIAKVTSTTVTETYEDGSYLVPCVLMVC